MLLNSEHDKLDLVEISGSSDTTLAWTAQQAGLTAEKWMKEDFDLDTKQVIHRLKMLRKLRPKRLWLSPGYEPYSQAGGETQTMMIQWRNCIRLAWVQLELGGYFYIEQPQECPAWQSQDTQTRQLLSDLSTSCIRYQCFDGSRHPRTGRPVKKSTRIQSMMHPLHCSLISGVSDTQRITQPAMWSE